MVVTYCIISYCNFKYNVCFDCYKYFIALYCNDEKYHYGFSVIALLSFCFSSSPYYLIISRGSIINNLSSSKLGVRFAHALPSQTSLSETTTLDILLYLLFRIPYFIILYPAYSSYCWCISMMK